MATSKKSFFSLIVIFVALLLYFFSATTISADDFLKCDACGRKISETYYTSDGHVYCSKACFENTLPRCAGCGKKMKSWLVTSDGRILCRKCYEKSLPQCKICGKTLESWIEINGNVYCRHHAAQPRCLYCGLPEGSITYSDGRKICPDCRKRTVTNKTIARNLFDEIRNKMKRRLSMSTDHKINFDLVSLDKLSNLSGSGSDRENGLFVCKTTSKTVRKIWKSIFGLEKSVDESKTVHSEYFIYILEGLPVEFFIDTCAHELAHDWMSAEYPNISDPKINEGFAEFSASVVNELYGNSHLNERKSENTDPIYGGGFRMIRDYLQNHEWHEFRDFLMSHSTD